jgi:hypothetical protein
VILSFFLPVGLGSLPPVPFFSLSVQRRFE